MLDWAQILIDEYGVNPTVRGALAVRRFGTDGPRSLAVAGAYVAAVRDVAIRSHRPDLAAIDHRIIAVGHNLISPSQMVDSGILEEFNDYWIATQDRPDRIESIYNSPTFAVFALFRREFPARFAKRLGERALGAFRGGRLVWRLAFQEIRVRRAERRKSVRHNRFYSAHLTRKSLAALGRVSATAQAAIMQHIEEHFAEYELLLSERFERAKARVGEAWTKRQVGLRPADLPWHVVTTDRAW